MSRPDCFLARASRRVPRSWHASMFSVLAASVGPGIGPTVTDGRCPAARGALECLSWVGAANASRHAVTEHP